MLLKTAQLYEIRNIKMNLMKMFTNSILFLLASFLFISCAGVGYIRSEPMYVEIERPRQPSSAYIWIEVDWLWQKNTRTYKNSNGRWEMPKHNKAYRPGHWENSRKGKRWVPGRWY
jgi:hypothetical protein